ncbi:MAG: transglycosylase SLT domain-containing protein [bacterium]
MLSIHGYGIVFAIGLSASCRDNTDKQLRAIAAGDVDIARPHSLALQQADTLLAHADSLVRAGRAWRATALLAPRLINPAVASPELRLAGARAAAGWDGWTEVDRLLRDAPWLDSQFGGDGREVLTRSALERGVDALPDAARALGAARDETSRVTRRVLLARAFDRANQRDSAASNYLAAASRLPAIADWLRLRAAGVTGDSAARGTLFVRVTSAAARARIAATDAQARERNADLDGAAHAFRRAGDEGSAFRVEALAARDDAARAAVAQRIVAFLPKAPSNSETRQALEVLDKLGALPPRDELIVARAAAQVGASARAVAGFLRAATVSPLSAADRMTYGAALVRAGRSADALRVYASITDDAALAPLAAYQRARTMMQTGDGAAARSALRDVAAKYAVSRAAAAPALLLLADLQVDDSDMTGAAQSLHEIITRFPSASQAPLARFRVGLIQWSTSAAASAQTFDSLTLAHPSDEEALAARYWAGRAYEKLGKKSEATLRFREVMQKSPLSYYAMLAAHRLSVSPWTAPVGVDSVAHIAGIDSAVQRIIVLQRLGMDVEARFEIDALAERGARAATDAPAVSQALVHIGEPARALRIALAAIDHGNASRALFRIAYPIVHEDALLEESRRNDLDPALVAGLIRQESSWNPKAVSPAAARGLMQLLPSVGASIAATRHYPLWNPALLFDPDVSLELGTAHLSSSMKRDTPPERALAAYNAGASRVTRWMKRPGADDPELFTEWVPFTETRDYVRLVLRNAAVYRALYNGMRG